MNLVIVCLSVISAAFLFVVKEIRDKISKVKEVDDTGAYPLPLLKANGKLVVVDNKDEMIAFDTYKWYIESSFTTKQMETVFYMLENYKRKFGETENYSELYSDYVAKMVVLTETV